MKRLLCVLMILALVPLMGACAPNQNGIEPDPAVGWESFDFWMDLVDMNVASATELAALYLDEGSDGAEKLERFIEIYTPLRIVVGNNLALIFDHYGTLTAAQRARLLDAQAKLADIDRRAGILNE